MRNYAEKHGLKGGKMGYSKYLLMLGAGLMQKPAIDGAHELGYHVTVADGNANALCAPLADRFEHIDLKDTESLNVLAHSMKKSGRLDAVFTAGTDFSASVAYIAAQNGLPGHTYEAALNATDKIRMRTCFAASAVASPHFTFADCAVVESMKAKLLNGCARVKDFLPLESEFPLVVKPCDNMGARGCRICSTAQELVSACEVAVRFSRTGRAIVEEYMDGSEFSIDSLVYQNKIVITGFADRHIYFPPYFIEMGHTMSTDLPYEDKCRVAQTFAQGVRALGLTHGAAKGDMKLTSNGPMVGEIAARLSGGYMSGWTFPYASGMNLTKEAIRLSSGEEIDLFTDETLAKMPKLGEGIWYYEPERFSAERAWISIPGKIQTVYGTENAKQTAGVKDVLPRVKEGDAVTFPVNNVEKCGNCIAVGATREKAVNAAENAVSEITIRLTCPCDETEDFLNGKAAFSPDAFELPPVVRSELANIAPSQMYLGSRPWKAQLPPALTPYISARDRNCKTLAVVLEQFASLCPTAIVNARTFWLYLIRGSLQGILYAADCALRS